ncbi:ADP-ribosylation factor-binding protein GGA1-like [Antedon mediterranea]|uniref:ADP-ribosylation factor-binding protein GGA1-like n=1 Tax=Antedon mediterranea TaxID=105859 RepID=UPI003AF9744B
MAGFTEDGETLETLLNKATNPTNREDDWEYIMAFCDRVNKELEGPQIAAQLLSHKIQSPQERESLQALQTTETCVKNCGEYFHREIGKFRFLNELIRLISPKYLGNKTKESVKKRIIELIYSWSRGIPEQTKIKEAYDMLKKQGLVKEDPTYMDNIPLEIAPPRAKQAVFEDEDKSKLLARLLKSKHPEDLQAANRLIKNMVKDHEKSVEKVSNRVNEIEKSSNNVKLLSEMLNHYSPDITSPQEKDLMRELYITCEKMRPNLFRLASAIEDKEDGIGEILEANDKLTKVMEIYREKLGDVNFDEMSSGDTPSAALSSQSVQPQHTQAGDMSSLIDLAGLDSASAVSGDLTGFNGAQISSGGAMMSGGNSVRQPTSDALLEQQLSSLGFGTSAGGTIPVTTQSAAAMQLDAILGTNGPPSTTNTSYPMFSNQPVQTMGMYNQNTVNMVHPSRMTAPSIAQPVAAPTQITSSLLTGPTSVFTTTPSQDKTKANKPPPALSSKAFAELEDLGKTMMMGQNSSAMQTSSLQRSTSSDVESLLLSTGGSPPSQSTLSQPQLPAQTAPAGSTFMQPAPVTKTPMMTAQGQPMMASKPSAVAATVLSLADIFVPLETIQPGVTPPLTIYEKNKVKTVFHFAKDSPRPDIQVLVVSTMSTNTSAIKGVVFQAAVPKTMRIKLQPPSATDLPVHNPILPPTAITQVMLVANPQKEKIRLKFKLQYTLDGKSIVDVGEVDKFPS